jgi:hypothetical protein
LIAGWSSPVARQAHNLKAVGSNPTPATNFGLKTNILSPFLLAFISSLIFASLQRKMANNMKSGVQKQTHPQTQGSG